MTATMRKGVMISGGAHAALIALALLGDHLFPSRDAPPLVLAEIEVVNGTDFDAALSTAPVLPNEGPNELSPPASDDQSDVAVAEPDAPLETPEGPQTVTDTSEPQDQPERPEIVFAPPPTAVPTELPRPSIAEIPSPDPLPNTAATPESPPDTEPLQPLASAPAQRPEAAPQAPPILEEAPAEDEPVEEPEETVKEPEPDAVAEEDPEAPSDNAPQQAAIPVAKPAEIAAADQASSTTEPAPQSQPKAEDKPEKPAQAKASGSTAKFAAIVTRVEKDALRLGIRQHFSYGGNRSDRSLRVIIEVRLGKNGKIVDGPTQIAASGGDPASQAALFRSGRRALLKAQNAGEFKKLPVEKYDGWQLIHVTFTPEEIGFSS